MYLHFYVKLQSRWVDKTYGIRGSVRINCILRWFHMSASRYGDGFSGIKNQNLRIFFWHVEDFRMSKTNFWWMIYCVEHIFKMPDKKILSGVYARKIVSIPYACFLFHVWHLLFWISEQFEDMYADCLLHWNITGQLVT